MDISNYNAFTLVECSNYYDTYGLILLNNKHNVKDFQETIYKVKEKLEDSEWCIDEVLQNEAFNTFDYYLLPMDNSDTIEI